MTEKRAKRLVVIDGKSVFYRGYYAMPNLSTADGTPTGGVFGFATLAIELIKKLEPDYVTVAWDKAKTNIRKRREIYPEYKAGRKPAPADFYEQIPILNELLEAFGWPLYEIDDYEADDILGAFALQAAEKDIETCLITSDLDALQLLAPKTKVYALKKGLSNIEEFDADYFEEKYGIKVEQFLDLKSLMGDSSDNLPGVPGVGQKTASALLQEYGTLENIYEQIDEIKPTTAKKLAAGKDSAFITKQVATIWSDVPVELDWGAADIRGCNLDRVAEVLQRLEFTSLVRRLPAHMRSQPEPGSLQLNEASAVRKAPWPSQLMLTGETVIAIVDDTLWLAPNRETVHKKLVQEVDSSAWRALEFATVITYDAKALYHTLANADVNVRFDHVHDIRQAAFLLEPLRRERSLSSLVGEEIMTPQAEMASLWQVYDFQVEAFSHQPHLKRVADEFDFPVIYPLFQMERRGVRLDVSELKVMSQELEKEHDSLEQEMFGLVGHDFNIASPAQLSEVLFTKLQLPTAGIKKGKTAFSTDQKTLDKLRGQHPIIELVERTRELAKLKNTYVDALPKQVDEAGRIHTTFSQDVASTGRLASSSPNLQNIPVRTALGRRIREAFVPTPGKVFVSADYSQFELRLAAVLAGDQELTNDFNSGVDIHTKTASDVYGLAIEQVTKDQRRDAKVINFGVLYGMSPHGLSAATSMSFSAAKQFIDQYFERRAPIRAFIDQTLDRARTEGYVETFYGRRRPTPDVQSSNFMVRAAAERAAANLPIQGTEADLMKRAMIQLETELKGLAEPVLQIHDSFLVECAPEDAEAVSKQMKQTMEAVAPELKIELDVDVVTGVNWGEL